MRRVPLLLVLLTFLTTLSAPVSAQSTPANAGTAQLSAVDTGNFPEVHAYLAVRDAAGQHIAGLPSAAFTLTENGVPVAAPAVLEADLGVQVTFVLNANAAFKTRDVTGFSRLEYIRQGLTDFVGAAATVDDLSVVAAEGDLIAHVSAGAPVVDALSRYATEFVGAADPYALLNAGLNYAGDVTPRPGMRRILVVFANGLPRPGDSSALTDLVARAQAAQVQIHTVFVGPDGAQATTEAQTLRELSLQTGGLDLLLDGPSALATLFQAIAGQRAGYRLSYRSGLNRTGQHQLGVAVQLPDGARLTTPAAAFQLRVEAPAVAQVTFPDGHPRPVQTAELLVDGAPVDTRQTPSLTALTWPLAGYTESLTRTVQVRVVDELGLSAESASVQVFVAVPALLPAPTAAMPAAGQLPNWWLASGGIFILLLAAGIGGAWYWRQRLASAPVEAIPARAPGPQPSVKPRQTQPLNISATLPMKPVVPTRRFQLPRVTGPRSKTPVPAGASKREGPAYLEVVVAGGGGASADCVELLGASLRIGRDPELVDAIFPDRSVSRLHARIAEAEPGRYRIFDEGSTSGTWVNFTQINGADGHALQPGDLINLGRVQLRFRVRGNGHSPNNGASG